MIQIGKYNTLRVTRKEPEGCYLTENYDQEAILFKREITEDYNVGDELEVFIYSDSEHPFIATFLQPKIKLNEFAALRVSSVNNVGAFLDWGLPKDLFVPFAEQKQKMEEGRSYLVYLYLDEFTNRLTASARWNKFIQHENEHLEEKQEVDLLIAERTDLGYKVVINNTTLGMLFQNEVLSPLRIGEKTKGYIKAIREDGKIDVRIRKPGVAEINDSERTVLEKLKAGNGYLPFGDKSDPAEIRDELGMSKKTFKQAIGSLYKKRLIKMEDEGIYII